MPHIQEATVATQFFINQLTSNVLGRIDDGWHIHNPTTWLRFWQQWSLLNHFRTAQLGHCGRL